MEEVFKALDDLEGCAEGIEVKNDYDILYQALTELKAIKEAKPSEALKSLEEMYMLCTPQRTYYKLDKCNNVIKQSLLKTQELNKLNAEYKELLRVIEEYVIPLVSIDDDRITDNEGYQYTVPKKEDLNILKRWLNNGKRIRRIIE